MYFVNEENISFLWISIFDFVLLGVTIEVLEIMFLKNEGMEYEKWNCENEYRKWQWQNKIVWKYNNITSKSPRDMT